MFCKHFHSGTLISKFWVQSKLFFQWQLRHDGEHFLSAEQPQPPEVSPRPRGPQRLCFVAQQISVLHIEHVSQSHPSRFMIIIWIRCNRYVPYKVTKWAQFTLHFGHRIPKLSLIIFSILRLERSSSSNPPCSCLFWYWRQFRPGWIACIKLI